MMKKKVTLLAVLLFSAWCSAQTVVELSEAGTLKEKISTIGTDNIQSLKINGPLNGTDISYLRQLCGVASSSSMTPIVEVLDLSEADIVSGGDSYYTELWTSDLNDAVKYYTEDHVLGSYMFSGCEWLKEIILPASTTEIRSRCFTSNRWLVSVEIPQGVKRIERWAFAGCTNLPEIVLPSTLLSVDAQAFQECNSLKKVTCLSAIPPAYGYKAFPSPETIKLVIREAYYEHVSEYYHEADGWKNFKEIEMQEDMYFPFVEEGKRWDYEYGEQVLTYLMQGDTIIGDKQYKAVYERQGQEADFTYLCAVREADRRVFVLYSGDESERLLYDFALSEYYDECVDESGMVSRLLLYRGIFTTDGNKRRSEGVFRFHPDDEIIMTGTILWIEGIGTPDYLPFTKNGWAGSKLLGCYKKGVRIAVRDDMFNNYAHDLWPLPSKPLVCEGRKWTYKNSKGTPNICQWIEGDTLVGDVSYKKVFELNAARYHDKFTHLCGLLRQDSGDVYWYSLQSQEERKIMRQGMARLDHEYDQCELYLPSMNENVTCSMIQARNLSSEDHTYRCMNLQDPEGNVSRWVEGIGYEDHGLYFDPECQEYELVAVYDGDECIYRSVIDDSVIPDGVSTPQTPRNADMGVPPVFDLQGRYLHEKPERGIYIQDGKKKVVK